MKKHELTELLEIAKHAACFIPVFPNPFLVVANPALAPVLIGLLAEAGVIEYQS